MSKNELIAIRMAELLSFTIVASDGVTPELNEKMKRLKWAIEEVQNQIVIENVDN